MHVNEDRKKNCLENKIKKFVKYFAMDWEQTRFCCLVFKSLEDSHYWDSMFEFLQKSSYKV